MQPRKPYPCRAERHSTPLLRSLAAAACLCAAVVLPTTARGQSEPSAAAQRERAITNVRIVVGPGRVIERGNIVIRDGLIVAVGKVAKVPPGADVIDAKGLTAYAGFIDAAHSGLIDVTKVPKPAPGKKVDFARTALAATRADNRQGLIPEFRAVSALKLDAAALEELRKSGFTAVHALPAGPIAGGQGTLIALGSPSERESVLREATFAQFQLAAARGGTYPSTLMGSMAHLRQAILDAQRYRRHRELFAQGAAVPRPPIDKTLDALNEVLSGRRRAVFTVSTADDVRRALSFAAEHKITPVIWGGKEAFRCIPELKQHKASVIVDLDFSAEAIATRGRRFRKRPPETPTPTPAQPGTPGTPGERRKLRKRPPGLTGTGFRRRGPELPAPQRVQEDRKNQLREQIAGLAALHRAGIPFAVSSRGLKNHGEVLTGLRKAVQHGLPSDAALAAVTTDAAALLGMPQRLGTLEAGKLAHIVLTTGPFDSDRTQIKHVLIEGRRFDYNASARPLQFKYSPAVAVRPRVPSKQRGGEQPTELKSDRLAARPFRTGGSVLIRNATVLTGTGKTLPGTSILIRNGKIAAIGKNLKAPPGVRVVDASGLFAMPGMIDTHSHIMITAGINESTQSIVPEVRIRDVINTDDDNEYRSLAGGTTAARLFHGSANVIGGQDAVVKLKFGRTAAEHLVPNAPQGVKFALGENVKARTARFPNTRLGVEATLKRAFLEAIDYRRRWQEYDRRAAALKGKPNRLLPPRRDLRLEALADIVNHKKFIHSHCYRADEILMLLRTASQLGIRVWSLQHVLEGYKVAPEIAAHGASCSTFSDWWAYKVEAYDAIPFNAALLREAGINTVIKSDNAELMRHLYLEAAKTVRYGNMHPDHALQAVTLNPAKELGLGDRIGSLEVGKDGDVALFNGHPLNGFSRCEMTLIEGEIYFSRQHAPSAMSPAGASRSRLAKPFAFPSPAVRARKLDLAAAESGRYVIQNAYLHVVSGSDIPQGSVLIENGKIAAIGKSVPVPSGTRVIDGRGLHVSPGFIDSGTTLGLVEIGRVRETQDFSEGGGIQPDLRAGVSLNRDSELIPVSRAGGITTILVRPTGGLIAGQASVARLAGWTTPEMIIELEAGLQINWPRAAPQLKQLTDFLQQARKYDKLRADAEKSKQRGPIVDPQLEALRPYLAQKKPVFFEAESRKAITDVLDFARKEKLRAVITGGAEAWKVADQLKKRNVPVIIGPVMRRPAESYDPFDAPYANPGRLFEAGVKFCIRSDNASNCRNTPFEAAMAVAYGLPEEQGLRAVTLSAAEILNVADRLGSLTKGKQATLVISDGPPLQHTSQVKGVFIDGVPHSPESRQTRFYDQYRRRLHEHQRAKATTAGQ